MKNFLWIVAVLLILGAVMNATAASHTSAEAKVVCQQFGEFTYYAAMLRDHGHSREDVMTFAGDSETLVGIVNAVFDNPDAEPFPAGQEIFDLCMAQLARTSL